MATFLKCDRCGGSEASIKVAPRTLGLISYKPHTVTADAKVDLCFDCAVIVGEAVALAMISSKVGA